VIYVNTGLTEPSQEKDQT